MQGECSQREGGGGGQLYVDQPSSVMDSVFFYFMSNACSFIFRWLDGERDEVRRNNGGRLDEGERGSVLTLCFMFL